MSHLTTRTERVILDLEDRFSPKIARAAVATRVFADSLDSASGSSADLDRNLDGATKDVDRVGASAQRADRSINQLTGRLRLMADTAAILGPGLVPIAAVGVPAVTGLASQLGFAAIGMASLVAASQGVGDALKAVQAADLEPTAANVQAAQLAMARLGPEAQEFVSAFQELRPTLGDVRDAAAAGWFPGLTEALGSLERVAPKVGDIFQEIGARGGALTAEFAEGLAGPEGREFLNFVEANAPQALEELGRTVGNVAAGMANLWMAMDPANDQFSGWLLDVSSRFRDWSDDLAGTSGFNEFLDYISEMGPKVGDLFASAGDAILQIAEAAAPLGGPVLEALTAVFDVVGQIADSDLGTPIMIAVGAYAALNRTLAITAALQRQVNGSAMAAPGSIAARGGIAGMVGGFGTAADGAERASRSFASLAGSAARVAGPIAGVAAATGALGDSAERSAFSFGLIGLAGGPVAGGVGLIAGAFVDAKSDADSLNDSLDAMNAALDAGDYKAAAQGVAEASQKLAEMNVRSETFAATSTGAASGVTGLINVFSGLLGQPAKAADEIDAARIAAERLADQSKATGGLEDALMAPLGSLSDGARVAMMSVEDLSDALAGLSGWLDRRGAVREYGDAIRELGEGVRNGFSRPDAEHIDAVGRSIVQVASAIKNKTARRNFVADAVKDLQQMADRAGPRAAVAIERLIDKISKYGGTKVNRPRLDVDSGPANRKLGQLRGAFGRLPKQVQSIVRLEGADLSQREIGKLQQAFRLTPKQVRTLVTLSDEAAKSGITNVDRLLSSLGKKKTDPRVTTDVGEALQGIGSVSTRLSQLPSSKTITITTHYRTTGNPPKGSADGSTVPKDGGPYGDRYPYLLAPGEEVISNRFGQADRHRALLKAINAGRAADGATVAKAAARGVSAGVGRSQVDVNLGDLRVRGTLKTPWGPAEVEGIALVAAQNVVDANLNQDNGYA